MASAGDTLKGVYKSWLRPEAWSSRIVTESEKSRVEVLGLPPLYVPGSDGDFMDVVVAFVNSCEEFFVQLENEVNSITKLSVDMAEKYSVLGIHELKLINPTRGQLVAARYAEDECWYRAIFLDRPTPSNFRMYFVDYGNVEVVRAGDIKVLSEEFLQRPPYALRCSLHDVASTPHRNAIFAQLIDSAKITILPKRVAANSVHVEVYVAVNDHDFNINSGLVNRERLPDVLQIRRITAPPEVESEVKKPSVAQEQSSQSAPQQQSNAPQPPQQQSNLTERMSYDQNYEDRRGGGRPDTGGRGCYNCGNDGHMSRDCPEPKKPRQDRDAGGGFGGDRGGGGGGFGGEHGGGFRGTGGGGFSGAGPGGGGFGGGSSNDRPGGGNRGCFNCGEDGHMSRECPNPRKQREDRGGGGFSGGGGGFSGGGGGFSGSSPGGGGFGGGSGNDRPGGGNRGCFNCGEDGHMSRECPNPRKPREDRGGGGFNAGGGGFSGGGGGFSGGGGGAVAGGGFGGASGNERPSGGRGCYNCGEDGHMSRDCPNPRKPREDRGGGFSGGGSAAGGGFGGDRPAGGGRGCFNCGEEGHMSRDCAQPRKPREGGNSGGGGRSCYNCGEEGHMSRDCSAPRQQRGGGSGNFAGGGGGGGNFTGGGGGFGGGGFARSEPGHGSGGFAKSEPSYGGGGFAPADTSREIKKEESVAKPEPQPSQVVNKAEELKKPKEEKQESYAAKYESRVELSVGKTTNAYMAHAVSPSDFYIHNASAEKALEVIQGALAALDKPKKLENLEKGTPCTAMYEGAWYRGEVMDSSDGLVTVFYVDYGNTEVVAAKDVYSLPKDIAAHPTQAIPCTLAWIKPARNDTWTANTIARFSHETANEIVKIETVGKMGPRDPACSGVGDAWPVFMTLGNTRVNEFIWRRGRAILSLPQYAPQKIEVDQFTSTPGKVVFVESPQLFYIVSEAEKQVRHAEKVKKKLSSFSKKKGPRLEVKANFLPMPCVAKCDGEYCRGLVRSLTGETAHIFFVDNGKEESVPLKKVYLSNSDLLKIPSLALKCKLFGMSPVAGAQYPPEATDMVRGLESVKFSVVYHDQGGLFHVEVNTGENDTGIGPKLVEAGHATKDEIRLQEPDEITPGTTFTGVISYSYSPVKFYVQCSGFNRSMDQLTSDFSKYKVKQKCAAPAVGDICASKFDNAWNRCKILNVDEEKKEASVYYLDWGNTETAPFDDLYMLPYPFFLTKSCAVPCALAYLAPPEGSEAWPAEAGAYLQELMEEDVVVTVHEGPSEASPLCQVDLLQSNAYARKKLLDEKWASELKHVEQLQVPVVTSIPGPTVHHLVKFPATFGTDFESLDVFYLHDCCNLPEMELLALTASTTDESPSATDVTEGSEVLGKFDGQYYRGRVLSIDESEDGESLAHVLYLDYGNGDSVPVSSLKQLSSDLMKIPQQAIPCKLADPLTESQKENAESILSDISYFEATVMDNADGYFLVKLAINGRDLASDILLAEEQEQMTGGSGDHKTAGTKEEGMALDATEDDPVDTPVAAEAQESKVDPCGLSKELPGVPSMTEGPKLDAEHPGIPGEHTLDEVPAKADILAGQSNDECGVEMSEDDRADDEHTKGEVAGPDPRIEEEVPQTEDTVKEAAKSGEKVETVVDDGGREQQEGDTQAETETALTETPKREAIDCGGENEQKKLGDLQAETAPTATDDTEKGEEAETFEHDRGTELENMGDFKDGPTECTEVAVDPSLEIKSETDAGPGGDEARVDESGGTSSSSMVKPGSGPGPGGDGAEVDENGGISCSSIADKPEPGPGPGGDAVGVDGMSSDDDGAVGTSEAAEPAPEDAGGSGILDPSTVDADVNIEE